jgi:predicted NUDIX family phosphoesterase
VGDAAGRPVAIRETDKLTGSFVSTAEVAALVDHLETWSRLAFEFIETLAALR